jgi:acetoacetyl-CoA synthetase
MIYAAPTIARMAAALDSRAAAEFSPLVPIKPGVGAPLFIVHGVGGNVMELFALGRQIQTIGPVYAIQARGLDGRQKPNRSIAAMAEDYLAEIRKAFPEGPYHLAGYSSGGLTAFEIARWLEAAGEPPASLTLIDTQTNARQWPLAVWMNLLASRARHHLGVMREYTPREAVRYAASIGGSLHRRILWRFAARDTQVMAPEMRLPPALQAVYRATMAAIANYRPGRYRGGMLLILPEETDPHMASPARIWRGRGGALETLVVPGNHRTMIQGRGAADIAAAMSRAIAR